MKIFEKFIGQHVVVRSYAAGVHIGTLSDVTATTPAGLVVVLTDARRLWKWGGAFTLSEVATAGINPRESRMAAAVPEHLVSQVIEILPTSEAAQGTFNATHE